MFSKFSHSPVKTGLIILAIIPFIGFIVGYAGGFLFFQSQTQQAPNLVGKSLRNAIECASASQLALRLLQEKEDILLPEGTVIQQTPHPEQKMRLNQSIFVTISKKPTPDKTPILLTKKIAEITPILTTAGITPQIIACHDTHEKDICIAQAPQAGQTIQNQKVTLYTSDGPAHVYIMPNLKGARITDLAALEQRKNVTIEAFDHAGSVSIAQCPERIITEQRPVAGALVNLRKPLRIQILVN